MAYYLGKGWHGFRGCMNIMHAMLYRYNTPTQRYIPASVFYLYFAALVYIKKRLVLSFQLCVYMPQVLFMQYRQLRCYWCAEYNP